MQNYLSTDLLLNKDFSSYHINLKPDEIGDTIFLVGDKDRVPVISQYFDKITVKKEKREFYSHTGFYNNSKITAISTGIGTDNIDIVVNELDSLANINLEKKQDKDTKKRLKLIRIGTCGIIQDDIPVGSPIVSDFALGLDNLMSFYEFENSKEEKEIVNSLNAHIQKNKLVLDFYLAESTSSLREKFKKDFFHGITITAPGFYAPQGRKLRYKLSKPNLIEVLSSFKHNNHRILNFEMETSAIYGLSKILGHDAITIDLGLANRKQNKAEVNYYEAMSKLVKRVLDIVVE
jgi:uridine phosphorylase